MYIKTSIILIIVLLTSAAQAMSESYLTFTGGASNLRMAGNRVGDLQIEIRELINKNPDLSYLTSDSPLLKIVEHKERNNLVKLMLDHGANPNVRDDMGDTPLHDAAEYNNAQAITLLLQAGAHINCKQKYGGETPLHTAIKHNSYEALHTLLYAGAHLNEKDRFGDTPLHTALQQELFNSGLCGNRYKIVKLLLQYGADPLAQNKAGENALTIIQKEYVKALQKFQDWQADPYSSEFALKHKASAQEYKKVAQLLIAHVGLYAKQGRIAHEGLAQVLPDEIAHHIASYVPEYVVHDVDAQIKQQDQEESHVCPICLEKDSEAKAGLACGHNDFHVACLEQWKEMNTSTADKCPLCRQEL